MLQEDDSANNFPVISCQWWYESQRRRRETGKRGHDSKKLVLVWDNATLDGGGGPRHLEHHKPRGSHTYVRVG